MEMTHEVWRLAIWWGPGILIVLAFGYGFMRLAHYWIEKNAEVKRHQLETTFGIARQYVEQFLNSQRSQSDALARLAASVEQRETRESFEHQEILIALKALHQELRAFTSAEARPLPAP